MSSRAVKIAVSLLLSVTVLCCSFSVFADDEPTPSYPPYMGDVADSTNLDVEEMWGNAGNYLVWLILDSWGIHVTVDDVEVYNDAVRATIDELVFEFLDSLPSPMSLYAWVNPWTWDRDFWGNYRFNSSMLEDIDDLAEYIKTKFNLTDNDSVEISPSYTVSGGYTLYQFDQFYECQYQDGYVGNWRALSFVDTNNSGIVPLGYFVVSKPYVANETLYCYYIIVFHDYDSGESFGFNVEGYNVSTGQTSIRLYGGLTVAEPEHCIFGENVNGYTYNQVNAWVTNAHGYIVPIGSNLIGSDSDIEYLCQNFVIESHGSNKIVTTHINTPDIDTGYTPGDDMIIIDGEPSYQVIEFPDTISVDNLPAVISPTTINDPDLEGVYGEVTPFIRTFSGGMDMMRSIIMQLPEEVIACLFALMGAIIIFGFIKIMREH